jgi:precorrin-2 methylase
MHCRRIARGGFLVWGDPTLYDSTIRIIELIKAGERADFDYEVIPGISSVQALVAKHRLPINLIGEAIHVTTGRKLAEGLPPDIPMRSSCSTARTHSAQSTPRQKSTGVPMSAQRMKS